VIQRAHRFWSNVMAVAYKEATVIRHDRPFLAVVFLQPVVQMTMFFVLSNTPHNVPWAVLDRSDTTASRRLVTEIQTSGYFLPWREVRGYDEGHALLESGKAAAVLVIPRDFARSAVRGGAEVQLLLDASDPLSAARIGGYVTEIAAASGDGAPGRRDPGRVGTTTGAVDLRQRFWFNPTLDDRTFFFSVLAAILLTNLCLSATSLALIGERENGTYEQMLALPTTPVELILGKLIPYVVICYVDVAIAVVAAGLLVGLWPHGSWLTLVIVTFPFILASLGVGTFISSVARNSAQAVFLSVFFILPSFVLSGLMMPYRLMPDGVRQIGAVLPTRWYQIALRGVMSRGAGLIDVALPTLVLVTMFVVTLTAVAWRMKPRLD
jgi:ABC-2 type transport system permease protein